ncbi:sensor histidine kinase [Actinomycetospora termitidis]|uniref:histidine kinase n=1 Tax=Actinomycetospora termitidis TaxID=3053470 RepID=A0ABT7MC80_9PSEU|nr:histidine kinase [Actinomycetospora sp. Odt1-22]MDL5158272.1 histidine kinase [Actinomycetospora sp. Odt1-22]
MTATTTGHREPPPRPAFQTAGVPRSEAGSRLAGLGQALRPLLWLSVIAGTVWPLTPGAIAGGAVVLVGALCAVAAARDPRIATEQAPGDAWRTLLLVLCALSGLVATSLSPAGAGYATVFIAAGLAGRVVLDGRLVWTLAVVAAVALSAVFALSVGSPWGLLLGLSIPVLASQSLNRARLHREHARVVALLAERDALREAEIAGAAAQERARIARDLHDVLAHSLSGLSLHLQAIRAVLAKRLGPDDAVVASVDTAADLARSGLAEAKEAVAALRSTPAPTTPDLQALVDRHDAGLTVDGDLDGTAPEVREAVFAAVREALTNAGRHAPGARTGVTVTAGPDTVEATVTNTAPIGTPAVGVGGGNGLVGLRERAALVGGTVEAGPHDDGWRVVLRVPVSGRLMA